VGGSGTRRLRSVPGAHGVCASKDLRRVKVPTSFAAPSMANAIFKTGGKQYRAAEGDRLRVPSIEGEPGQAVTFDEVLVVGGDSPKFGKPTVAGAKVQAEIVRQGLDKKVIVFKFKRRKRYMRKAGHRQAFTEVKITGISA